MFNNHKKLFIAHTVHCHWHCIFIGESIKKLIFFLRRKMKKVNTIQVWKYFAPAFLAVLHLGFQNAASLSEIVICTHKNWIHSPTHGTIWGALKFMQAGSVSLCHTIYVHAPSSIFKIYALSRKASSVLKEKDSLSHRQLEPGGKVLTSLGWAGWDRHHLLCRRFLAAEATICRLAQQK